MKVETPLVGNYTDLTQDIPGIERDRLRLLILSTVQCSSSSLLARNALCA